MASLHPNRAVSYFKGNRKKANATPAILWLFLALVGIIILRTRSIPSLSQAVMLAIFCGIIVAAGLFLPGLVTLLLVGLLVAAVLQVPAVAPFLNAVQRAAWRPSPEARAVYRGGGGSGMERDIAKVATLLVMGAILVNVATHGNVFVAIGKTIGNIWTSSLSTVAGSPNVTSGS